MKPISKKYDYDEEFLDPRVPEESKFLLHFETDLPFFVAENFFTAEVCDRLVEAFQASGVQCAAEINQRKEDGTDQGLHDPDIRHTEHFQMTKEQEALYQEAFGRVRGDLEAFFRVRLATSEGVQVLGYPPGGKYEIHADNCDPKCDATGEFSHWVITAPNRTISTILFLTDAVPEDPVGNQCVGGEVVFEYLYDKDFRPAWFKPRKGCLVAFPSNPYYSHNVLPVTAGYRITMVEWYKAELNKS